MTLHTRNYAIAKGQVLSRINVAPYWHCATAGKAKPLAVIASDGVRAPLIALFLSLAVSVPAAQAQQ
jgi:hypothetical protein